MPQRCPVHLVPEVLGGRFAQQFGTFGKHEFDVDPGVDLHLGVVVPGAVAVVPGFDHKGPVPGFRRREHAFPAVRSHAAFPAGRREPHTLALRAGGVQEHGAHTELVMPFAEGGGAHHDGFAGQGFGRKLAALDDGLHCGNGKTPEPKALRDTALGHFGGCGTGS